MKKFLFAFIILSQFALSASAATADITINGLVCDFCARSMESVFGKRDEVESIKVDMDSSVIHIRFREGQTLDDATLTQLIADSGYAVRGIERSGE